MRHKHADFIHAWAEGAEIEWQWGVDWISKDHDGWRETERYRIKPTPKPDVVKRFRVYQSWRMPKRQPQTYLLRRNRRTHQSGGYQVMIYRPNRTAILRLCEDAMCRDIANIASMTQETVMAYQHGYLAGYEQAQIHADNTKREMPTAARSQS